MEMLNQYIDAFKLNQFCDKFRSTHVLNFISKKMFVCNTNSFCNIDYGEPIIASKSTDYRTSTGKGHRYLPIPDLLFTNYRTKANLNSWQLKYDVAIKDDTFQSTYRNEYVFKQTALNKNTVAPHLGKVNYGTQVEERIFKDPAPPRDLKASEMKDSYGMITPIEDAVVYPPEIYAKCEIKALGRDEQPPVPPQLRGYYRHMDNYVSTNRADFIHYNKDQQDGIGRKDIVTYYDASNIPRGGKGYGPKNGPTVEPLLSIRKFPIYDKATFKEKFNDRIIPNKFKSLPHAGKRSEYQTSYYLKTNHHIYPKLFQCGEEFEDSLPNAGLWQNLAPPAMYCTEYCHIGSGWPTSSVIEPKKPAEYERAIREGPKLAMCSQQDSVA